MNDDGFDTELRGRCQELRSRELAEAPDFDTMLAAARETVAAETETESVVPIRRRSPTGARGFAMAAGIVAAALALLWLTPTDQTEGVGADEFDALVRAYSQQSGGGSWRAPTDGLLEVPGIEFVRSVPTIDGYQRPDGATAPAGDNG